METLVPHGAMVVVEAEHMCMTMRGREEAGFKHSDNSCKGYVQRRCSGTKRSSFFYKELGVTTNESK